MIVEVNKCGICMIRKLIRKGRIIFSQGFESNVTFKYGVTSRKWLTESGQMITVPVRYMAVHTASRAVLANTSLTRLEHKPRTVLRL